MASIIYKPVCSECGAIITDEVYGIRYTSFNDKVKYKFLHGTGVSPSVCKNCGTGFDSIIIEKPEIEVKEMEI